MILSDAILMFVGVDDQRDQEDLLTACGRMTPGNRAGRRGAVVTVCELKPRFSAGGR
jgi:hypothetical protein